MSFVACEFLFGGGLCATPFANLAKRFRRVGWGSDRWIVALGRGGVGVFPDSWCERLSQRSYQGVTRFGEACPT